jgi:hypothetical protein
MSDQLLNSRVSASQLTRQRLDITSSVCICDTRSVCEEIRKIFLARFPGHEADFATLESMFADIGRLYAGTYPDYHACDTDYHDMRHILDVTLAAMRLYDGYEKVHGGTGQAMGMERIQLGVACALFHDIGYLRHHKDTRHHHGAEYTKIHVTRGTHFLARYLPTKGKPEWASRAKMLLHYTGYEKTMHMKDEMDHMLGCLLGTADLIAQMSDQAYLERCRDFLYQEFRIGKISPYGAESRLGFESPVSLLDQTPEFIRNTITKRLDGLFGSVYHYAAEYFGGENFYMEGIDKNCRFLEALLEERNLHLLSRKPR